MKKKVLGRGLEALLPRRDGASAALPAAGDRLAELDIDRIRPNPFQPRARFDEPELDELASSIRANGIVHPILVRPAGAGYQIIAGERRWRAAQRADLKKIPALIRSVPDNKVLELALVENIQRQELNPIEEAGAFARLMDDFGLSQEEVAERVGRNRATVANILRLLRLSSFVRDLMGHRKLAMGHGRALLGLEAAADQKRAAQLVIDKDLSVRDTEALVRRLMKETAGARSRSRPIDPNRSAAEAKLRLRYKTQVRIRGGKKGAVQFSYFSEEELERLYEDLLRT